MASARAPSARNVRSGFLSAARMALAAKVRDVAQEVGATGLCPAFRGNFQEGSAARMATTSPISFRERGSF